MMRNRENLDRIVDVSVDDCDRETPKGNAAEIWGANDLVAVRGSTRVSRQAAPGDTDVRGQRDVLRSRQLAPRAPVPHLDGANTSL